MIKYLVAALLLIAACKTTDAAPIDCKDTITAWGNEQKAAGRVFSQQGLLAPNTYAIVFADATVATTYYVLGLVMPGGVIPPTTFHRAGSCVTQGVVVQVYTGTVAAQQQSASTRPI